MKTKDKLYVDIKPTGYRCNGSRVTKDGKWDKRFKKSKELEARDIRERSEYRSQLDRSRSEVRPVVTGKGCSGLQVLGTIIVIASFLIIGLLTMLDSARREWEEGLIRPISRTGYELVDTGVVLSAQVADEVAPAYCEGEIESMICAKDWDDKTMIAVALCESRMNPEALNDSNFDGSWDTGVMQINSVHGYPLEQLVDAQGNIDAAYEIFQAQGVNAWVAYRTPCFAREFMALEDK